MTTTALPKPGQIADMGGRPYLVTLVTENEPGGDAAASGSHGATHLVRLLSLHEDAFGDEGAFGADGTYGEVSEIIWEDVPGISARERPGLPDISSNDQGNGCSALESALRWGVVDFIRRDMGPVDPATQAGIECALLDGRMDLGTYWPQKEANGPGESTPLQAAVLAMIEERLGIDPDAPGEKTEQAADAFTPDSSAQDYARRLKERLKESATNVEMTAAHLRFVVDFALSLAGQPELQPLTMEGEPVDPGVWSEEKVFRMPGLSGPWAKCAEGLEHPQRGAIRPITFDPKLGGMSRVLCHLGHPLVQMAAKLLRRELLATGEKKTLSGFMIGCLDDIGGSDMVIAHGLLLVTGATGHLLHQEVISSGVETAGYGAPPRVMSRQRLKNVGYLGVGSDEAEGIRASFRERWQDYKPAIAAALKAEVESRMKNIERSLMKRRKERLADEIKPHRKQAEAIRIDLKTLLAALEDPDGAGAGEETAFLEENLATFRAQLSELEAEANRGAGEIKQRYSDPQAWLIPATMEILEPRNIDHMF